MVSVIMAKKLFLNMHHVTFVDHRLLYFCLNYEAHENMFKATLGILLRIPMVVVLLLCDYQ